MPRSSSPASLLSRSLHAQPTAIHLPDDVQLDLMEKDIVIEQLRTQVKQLRSRIAVLEEEQAADTAPLQGLLNQLGELKVRK